MSSLAEEKGRTFRMRLKGATSGAWNLELEARLMAADSVFVSSRQSWKELSNRMTASRWGREYPASLTRGTKSNAGRSFRPLE